MKKIFLFCAALLFCVSIFADITRKCTITMTSDQGGTDVVKLIEDDEYTSAFENEADASKAMNSGNTTNLNIYVRVPQYIPNDSLGVVVTNDIEGYPISIQTNKVSTNYTLTFSKVQGTIYLYDSLENKLKLMENGGTYQFTAPANTFQRNRFWIGYHNAKRVVSNVCQSELPYTYHSAKDYLITNDTTIADTIFGRATVGYDSVSVMDFVVNRYKDSLLEVSVCEGDYYSWRGKNYSDAKTYYDTVRYSISGCDSMIYSLSLTKKSVQSTQLYDTLTLSEAQLKYSQFQIAKSGEYVDTLTAVNDCDSIVKLALTIVSVEPIDTTIYDTICRNADIVHRTGTMLALTHDTTFTDTIKNAIQLSSKYFRDSLYIYNIKVNQPTASDTFAVACSEYTWHGMLLTQSGDTTWTTTNAVGCDSVVTLHLTINYPTTGDTTAVACESFTWHGMQLTQSGDTTWTTTNVAGCDSVVTLHLTINYPTSANRYDTLCLLDAQQKYPDLNITATGKYMREGTSVRTGCDSTTYFYITVLTTPSVPDISALGAAEPVVVCGYPIDLSVSREAIANKLQTAENDTTSKVEEFWFESQVLNATVFKRVETTSVFNYFASPMRLRLVMTTACGDTLYGNPVAYDVEKPTPQNVDSLDEMQAITKYNHWLLMIHYNNITALGYTLQPNNVTWYQVVGEPDPVPDFIDDIEVGKGYYYTADKSLSGDYYAVLDAAISETNLCGATMRTLIVHCNQAAKMTLAPNVIRTGETMQLRGILTDETTQIRMYDCDGKMIDSYSTTGAEELTLRPQYGAGIYMLRATNGEQDEAFKYVVTK